MFLGYSVPVMIRRTDYERKFVFIGEYFLERFMSSEALENNRFGTQEFCIY
jgi:hypothetical protein